MCHGRRRTATPYISPMLFLLILAKYLLPWKFQFHWQKSPYLNGVLLAYGFSCLTFWYEINTVHSVFKCSLSRRLVPGQTCETDTTAGICHYKIEKLNITISFNHALYMRHGISVCQLLTWNSIVFIMLPIKEETLKIYSVDILFHLYVSQLAFNPCVYFSPRSYLYCHGNLLITPW